MDCRVPPDRPPEQQRALARLAPHPGHRKWGSRRIRGRQRLRLEGDVDDLADLMDAIGWRSAAVAGASQLTAIPAARHFTPIEVPDRIAAELAALLRGGAKG